MANPFLNKTFLGAAARFMPGQNSPFSGNGQKPYERKRNDRPINLGNMKDLAPPKKRKKRDIPTS